MLCTIKYEIGLVRNRYKNEKVTSKLFAVTYNGFADETNGLESALLQVGVFGLQVLEHLMDNVGPLANGELDGGNGGNDLSRDNTGADI